MSFQTTTKYGKYDFELVSEYLALSILYSFESVIQDSNRVEMSLNKNIDRLVFVDYDKKFVIASQPNVYNFQVRGFYDYCPHLYFYINGKEYLYHFPTKGWCIFKSIDQTQKVYKKHKELENAVKQRIDELREKDIENRIGDLSP